MPTQNPLWLLLVCKLETNLLCCVFKALPTVATAWILAHCSSLSPKHTRCSLITASMLVGFLLSELPSLPLLCSSPHLLRPDSSHKHPWIIQPTAHSPLNLYHFIVIVINSTYHCTTFYSL